LRSSPSRQKSLGTIFKISPLTPVLNLLSPVGVNEPKQVLATMVMCRSFCSGTFKRESFLRKKTLSNAFPSLPSLSLPPVSVLAAFYATRLATMVPYSLQPPQCVSVVLIQLSRHMAVSYLLYFLLIGCAVFGAHGKLGVNSVLRSSSELRSCHLTARTSALGA